MNLREKSAINIKSTKSAINIKSTDNAINIKSTDNAKNIKIGIGLIISVLVIVVFNVKYYYWDTSLSKVMKKYSRGGDKYESARKKSFLGFIFMIIMNMLMVTGCVVLISFLISSFNKPISQP